MAEHEIVIRVVVEQTQPPSPAPAEDFVEVKGKEYTPSQLLRFALKRRYDKLWPWPEGAVPPFEGWYKEQMERIISVITNQK